MVLQMEGGGSSVQLRYHGTAQGPSLTVSKQKHRVSEAVCPRPCARDRESETVFGANALIAGHTQLLGALTVEHFRRSPLDSPWF